MAKIFTRTPEDEAGYQQWLAERPSCIQEMARRFPADRLYLLKSSGHRVTIYSYSEAGTMTVTVSGQYNLVDFARNVFGIDPDDLVECDWPPEGEKLGAMLTDKESIERHIRKQRQAMFN